MPIITNPIPQQQFEVIRDRIALIIAEELASQCSAGKLNRPDLNATVWVERFTTFDNTELPAINVKLDSGVFDWDIQTHQIPTYTYHIDIHVNSKQVGTADADKAAMLKAERLAGIVRAILHDPRYNTLAFAKPSISRRQVTRIDFYPGESSADALSTAGARLTFTVASTETVELSTAQDFAGITTKVKIHNTEIGYKYEVTESY